MHQIAKERGFALNRELLNSTPVYVRNALVVGSMGELGALVKILAHARRIELDKETGKTRQKVSGVIHSHDSRFSTFDVSSGSSAGSFELVKLTGAYVDLNLIALVMLGNQRLERQPVRSLVAENRYYQKAADSLVLWEMITAACLTKKLRGGHWNNLRKIAGSVRSSWM